MPNLAPIALFVYNRPKHTRRTLEALAADPLAGQSDLIIYADGPKTAGDTASVKEVREIAESVTGFRRVDIRSKERNAGLANSIIAGVSEICEQSGRVIVLEDDLIVAPKFLDFMNAGLDRYADHPEVYQVSGYLFPGCEGIGRPRFLPLTTTWGWATWTRAWKTFDESASAVTLLRADSEFRTRFDLNGAYDYSGMVEQQLRGAIDSWGVRWYLSVFAQEGLTLYPGSSLVENIGFDGSGTHGAGQPKLNRKVSVTQGFRSSDLPRDFVIDRECMNAIGDLLRSMRCAKKRWLGVQRLKIWLKI
jgi:hypothetical protein